MCCYGSADIRYETMGIIQKQSFGSAFMLVIGILLGFVSAGILLPRFFTEEQNGLITLLNSYSLIYSQIILLGLPTAIIRFFPRFSDKIRPQNDFLTFCILALSIAFLIFIGFYYLAKPIMQDAFEKSPLFESNYFLLLPLTFFTALFFVVDGYSSALFKTVRGFLFKDVIQRILVIGLIAAYIYLAFSFSLFVLIYVACLCLPALVLFMLLWKEKHFFLGLPNWKLYRAHFREISSVSGYAILTGITYVGITNIDAIMVERFLNLEQAGIYGRNMFFGILVAVPYRAIHKISSGVLSASFKENDLENVKQVYYKSCTNQMIIGLFLWLALWVNIDNVYQMIPQSYEAGKFVIFYIGLGSFITMAGGVNTALLSYSPYYRYNSYFLIFLLVLVIGTNLIFIPWLGITGAALATAISQFLYNALMYVFIWRKYRFQPFRSIHVFILLIGLTAFGAGYYIPTVQPFYLDIAVRTAVFALVFSIPVLVFRLSPDMNNMLKFLWTKLRDLRS